MQKKLFNIFGWFLFLGIGAFWIVIGYSSWFLLLFPLAYICLSISNDSIKKLSKIKQMSISQVQLILIAFVLSVGIVFALLRLSNYFINDILHLTGSIKTISIVIAIIILLYPVKFAFWSIAYKINEDLNKKQTM